MTILYAIFIAKNSKIKHRRDNCDENDETRPYYVIIEEWELLFGRPNSNSTPMKFN